MRENDKFMIFSNKIEQTRAKIEKYIEIRENRYLFKKKLFFFQLIMKKFLFFNKMRAKILDFDKKFMTNIFKMSEN